MTASIINYYRKPNLVITHSAFNQNAFSQFKPEAICSKYFKVIEQKITN